MQKNLIKSMQNDGKILEIFVDKQRTAEYNETVCGWKEAFQRSRYVN